MSRLKQESELTDGTFCVESGGLHLAALGNLEFFSLILRLCARRLDSLTKGVRGNLTCSSGPASRIA